MVCIGRITSTFVFSDHVGIHCQLFGCRHPLLRSDLRPDSGHRNLPVQSKDAELLVQLNFARYE